jgi:hypothetical protein
MKSNKMPWAATVATAVAMTCVTAAHAYPIDVKSNLNGMDLKLNAVGDASIAAIEIKNDDSRTARCQVEFVNGPELPDRNMATVQPGKAQTVRFAAKRTVIKLDINVSCNPAEGAK